MVAATALVSLAAGLFGGAPLVAVFGAIAGASAYATFLARGMSSFLKIFVAIFAAETVVFGLAATAAGIGLWPASLAEYRLPESLPITVALFAILVVAVSHLKVVRAMTNIADRYFDTDERGTARIWPFPRYAARERRIATAMVVFLVLVNQAQVGINVRLSFFSRDWFNAIQAKDEATFWYQLFAVFLPWAVVFVTSAVIEFVVQSMLIIRWRRWLTDHFVGRWLDGATHYRMSLVEGGADNPDQRIAEDVNRFIDGGSVGYGIYSFSILLISTLSSLVSFSIVLWGLSSNFTIPGTEVAVPGFLFWVALVYAGFGTAVTHLIGRPLVRLSFERQRYEADFRFSLARLREYGEQVALLAGEGAERTSLGQRFGGIIRNYLALVQTRKRLTIFTAAYGQMSPFIPYIVAAPFYFAGKIQLGTMSQTASAFGRVEAALTFFVTYYVSLADFRSVLDRLTSFDASIDRGRALGAATPLLARGSAGASEVALSDLEVALPDGRTILTAPSLQLAARQAALLTGPSGSGKSTLFRAIAGIWPFGRGRIATPPDRTTMLLPQRPYIPIGTLRAAVTYPGAAGDYDEATIRAALEAARLPQLANRLDEENSWAQVLSLGEQQRLAVARALLAKPDWLFLDEATAALDEPTEAEIYRTLRRLLPGTTVVSIGHRGTLAAFHDRRIDMRPGQDGRFTPADLPQPAPLAAQ
ncbi:MAG: ABC transporter ATP-binding protein/permease [Methylobacteriaceae bacterium]|nr:ABC transporter ATP-binding protein/permease [Methylobacteriaceae bacterium]